MSKGPQLVWGNQSLCHCECGIQYGLCQNCLIIFMFACFVFYEATNWVGNLCVQLY